jgi:hypothetical protein
LKSIMLTMSRLREFFAALGERYQGTATIELSGSAALVLLGAQPRLGDLDISATVPPAEEEHFWCTASEVATEFGWTLDRHNPDRVTLAARAYERSMVVGQFGNIDVLILDLYSIAAMKIGWAREEDLTDVVFMLSHKLIEYPELERLARPVIPALVAKGIDRRDYRMQLEQLKTWERRH